MAGYSMGLAAGTNIPIEHLDYNYIRKCNNASEIEKILRVLRWVQLASSKYSYGLCLYFLICTSKIFSLSYSVKYAQTLLVPNGKL